MNSKNWNDRADKDLFFTILSVKNIGVISGSEWITIGNSMRLMGYGFTNEGCRQHFQGLRRAQNKLDQNGSDGESPRKVDPTMNPITRRPGPGRGRPKKSTGEANVPDSAASLPDDKKHALQPLAGIAQPVQDSKPPLSSPQASSQQYPHQHQPHQPQQPQHQQQHQHQQPQPQPHQQPHPQPTSFQAPHATPAPQISQSPAEQQQPPRYPSPPVAGEQSISPHQTQMNQTLTPQGQQSAESHSQPTGQPGAAPGSATANGSAPQSEPLRFESEDGEGEVDDGPEGPPIKRQRMEDDDLGQDQTLDDDPVLALASANSGAGAPDYHSEFDYAEA